MIKIDYNRKTLRLKDYDYSNNGMYFITICTKNREPILSKIHKKTMQTPVGADALICPDAKIELKNAGKILNKYIQNVNNVYENVNINSYVIMPDHFHIIIFIDDVAIKQGSMRASTPTNKITISKIIRGIKSLTTREIGYSIWQRNYYEHIIRNEKEYYDICKYIEQNPLKWIQNVDNDI